MQWSQTGWEPWEPCTFSSIAMKYKLFLQVLNTSLNFWTWWRIRVSIVMPWSCTPLALGSTRCVNMWHRSMQAFYSLTYVFAHPQHLEWGQEWDSSCLCSGCAGNFISGLLLIVLISYFSSVTYLQDISNAYGEYLIQKQLYEQAALVFARAGIFEKALDAFQNSGSWQQALCMASQLGYTKDKLSSLAHGMAGRPWGDGSVQSKTGCCYFWFILFFPKI